MAALQHLQLQALVAVAAVLLLVVLRVTLVEVQADQEAQERNQTHLLVVHRCSLPQVVVVVAQLQAAQQVRQQAATEYQGTQATVATLMQPTLVVAAVADMTTAVQVRTA
jgi:NADH:ubiquinone oxidoreductase subunit 6 (subunit J)